MTASNPPPPPRLRRRRFGTGALLIAALLGAAAATGAAVVAGSRRAREPADEHELSAGRRTDAGQSRSEAGAGAGADATASAARRYQCPMHPSVVQDRPGDCPICGMKLVEIARQPMPDAGKAAAVAAVERYQCPMHPNIVQDHPGECPICGMKLVKVQPGAGGGEGGGSSAVPGLATVEIEPARQQLIGLTTEEATRGKVGGTWRTNGKVAIDETRVRHINVKVPGFVERVFVDFIGKPVRKGEPLFSIYSPELLAAQEEYALALRTRSKLAQSGMASDGDSLVAAARRKLQLWDVPDSEIRRIARTGKVSKTLTLVSPISGVVTKKDVVEGMKLDAGAMPYEIVDLSSVWFLADVYESELRFVKVGMPATLNLNAFPNRPFRGKVLFVDPLLDPKTRTVKVRLAFANPSGELRPEMFGEVLLQGTPREALRIPTDAVVDSGTQKVVFVALGQGKFQPREVRLGDSDGKYVEVVTGLVPGEQVVTRANFLVDSESRLRASLADLAGGEAREQGGARVLPEGSGASGQGGAPGAGHEGHGGGAGAAGPPSSGADPHAGHRAGGPPPPQPSPQADPNVGQGGSGVPGAGAPSAPEDGQGPDSGHEGHSR